jgi:starch phosphorylase
VIKYAKDKGTSNILYLLISTRYFDATDPRDKIFALVGLASDIDESFVDYSKSYEDVIRELSHMSLDGRIEATAGCVLDLWSFITRKEDDNITEPSWVVDWLRLKDSQYTPMMDAYPPTKLVIQRFPEIQFLKKGVKEVRSLYVLIAPD